MKNSLPRFVVSLIVVGAVLSFSLNLLAQTGAPADLLGQAYTTLAKADHDYKGHRVAAMKQIQAAEKALGVKVSGDGKGHEAQGVSDDQLRAAQKLLEQARAGLTGAPLKHVNQAIEQISVALKIK